MTINCRNKTEFKIDKVVDFGKELFAGVLRSRTGALSEIATLLRFQGGTKSFERRYQKLLPLITEIREAFKKVLLENIPREGLRLAILDDTDIKKTGRKFPKQQTHHNHSDNSFFSGMKVLSSAVYQNGKTAVVNSVIVGKEDNKLEIAKREVDMLTLDFSVDIFLFDAWYCKSLLTQHIQDKNKIFVSRTRRDTKVEFNKEEQRLDALFKSIPHNEYQHVKINGKSYWVLDLILQLKTYGKLRAIISKEGQHALLVAHEYLEWLSFSATFGRSPKNSKLQILVYQ